MLTAVDHVQPAAPPGSPPALAARGGCWFRAGAVELHLGIETGSRPSKRGSTRTTPWATGWSSWFDRAAPGHPQC